MNSPKTYLILLLALTTLGGGALAWRQYQELVELRASAINNNERGELQKKIADLEKANRALTDQLAALRGERPEGTDEMIAGAEERSGGAPAEGQRGQRGGGRGPGGQQFAAVRELMAKPEVQAMIASEQKALLESRYGALFRSLNLPAEQLDKLKSLLLDRQNVFQDVMAAARDQGIDPRNDRDAFNKMVADSRNSVNDSIKSLLGDTGYNQLNNFDQTAPQRNLVGTLQQRLSYSDTPLSASQAEQLVQILAANPAPTNPNDTNERRGGGGDFGGGLGGRFGGGPGMGGGGGGAITGANAPAITPAAVSQAQSVLNSTQLTALQQLQQQQQTAAQLQQLYRNAMQQATGNTTTGTNTGGRRRGGG